MSYSMYTLTDLTGRRAESHRIVTWMSYDAGPRFWKQLIIAVIATIIMFALTGPFIKEYSVFPGAITLLVTMFLLSKRASGSQERLWIKARRDQMKSDVGQFYVAGHRVNPLASPIYLLARNTAPVHPEEVNQ